MKPEPGDVVKVITDSETYEGIIMQRPAILDNGVVVLKLYSGYNIGIDENRIKKIEVVEKYKQKKAEKSKIFHKKNLPNVSILSFGGTISSKVDYRTGGVYADYNAEDFVQMIPELKNVVNLKAENVMSVMSEDFSPEIWQLMAKRIAEELNDEKIDGVVITQGTDTLHFSTAAISFFLRNLNKPVVFTAAQRSIDRGSSDAFFNLLCAVHAAAKFDGASVVTCMHGTSSDGFCILINGVNVRKMHTSKRDAFKSINTPPFAKVYEDGRIEILNSNYKKRNNEKVVVEDQFESKTALVYVYPGMDPDILEYYRQKKYKGIVIAATALGHVATLNPKYSLLKKLKELIDNGVSVVITSQAIYGRVHPYVYTNLRRLSLGLNCIFADGMLSETAYIKLGWVLAHAKSIDEVKEMMLTNYSGEIVDRITDI